MSNDILCMIQRTYVRLEVTGVGGQIEVHRTSVVYPNSFFPIQIRIHNFFSVSDSVSDWILMLIFWSEILCCSLLLYVFWNLYDREKKFSNWKTVFFSFKCLICDFCTIFFYFKQCLDPNPNPNPTLFWIRIQPKYSDFLGFGFGSSTMHRTHNYCWGRLQSAIVNYSIAKVENRYLVATH
jgi:hypothetical protein